MERRHLVATSILSAGTDRIKGEGEKDSQRLLSLLCNYCSEVK